MDSNRDGQNHKQNSNSPNGWENARENWDKWEEQQEKKNWDKWDSDASHNSYYNQPTHTPYDQGFSIAAVVCGLLSITLSCCPLSLSLGAMGILFAVLCHRKSKPLYGNSRMGLYLSIFGCIYGTVNLIYLVIQNLKNPVFMQQIYQIYESL
ncbi:MAG: hypothetical protein K2J60_04940 [Acetatifactor sp.]|nr:hypothetical protein [Acetatifactor sp.]